MTKIPQNTRGTSNIITRKMLLDGTIKEDQKLILESGNAPNIKSCSCTVTEITHGDISLETADNHRHRFSIQTFSNHPDMEVTSHTRLYLNDTEGTKGSTTDEFMLIDILYNEVLCTGSRESILKSIIDHYSDCQDKLRIIKMIDLKPVRLDLIM